MFAYLASIAALAGGEIWANRQVCPTIIGDNAGLLPWRRNFQEFTLQKLCSGLKLILTASPFHR
jgi:hypothetical protein